MEIFLAIFFGWIIALAVGGLLRRDDFYLLATLVYLGTFVFSGYMIYLAVVD